MTWVDAKGQPRDDGAPLLGTVSDSGAERLFAGSPMRWADILADDAAGRAVRRGPLMGTLRYASSAQVQRVTSSNVIGLLRGSDPRLAAEHVVISGPSRSSRGDEGEGGRRD
jgi:hypothetical protein